MCIIGESWISGHFLSTISLSLDKVSEECVPSSSQQQKYAYEVTQYYVTGGAYSCLYTLMYSFSPHK